MLLLEETICNLEKKTDFHSTNFPFILPIKHIANFLLLLFFNLSLLYYLLLSIFYFSYWYSFGKYSLSMFPVPGRVLASADILVNKTATSLVKLMF